MGSGLVKRVVPKKSRYSYDRYVSDWRNKFNSSFERHPFYIISVRKFLELYHNKDGAKMESHRTLKDRGDLVEIQSISKQPVIFVSHEWHTYTEPDPTGILTKHLCVLLDRMRSGTVHPSYHDPFKFKKKTGRVLNKDGWQHFVKDAYLWIDYVSIPDFNMSSMTFPSSSSSSSNNDSYDFMLRSDNNIDNFSPVLSYLKRSDMMIVLSPPIWNPNGADVLERFRKPMLLRTFLDRAWCVFEMFVFMLCRSEKDVMMVPNGSRRPFLLAPSLVFNLSPPGCAAFTCCAHNHLFRNGTVKCDKFIVGQIMNRVIDDRVDSLFRKRDHHQDARFLIMRKDDLMKGLPRDKCFRTCFDIDKDDSETRALAKLKRLLRWDDSEENEKSLYTGFTILKYAVMQNNYTCVRKLLRESRETMSRSKRIKYIEGSTSRDLLVYMNIGPKGTTNLMHAMMFSSPNIVKLLLDEGADPYKCCPKLRYDAFIFACCNHNVDNAAYWLKRFPKWDVNRQTRYDTTALMWVFLLPNSQENCVKMVSLLLSAGARLDIKNEFGFNPLHCAAYSWNIPIEAFNLMIKHVNGDKKILEMQVVPKYFYYNILWHIANWRIKKNSIGIEDKTLEADKLHHVLYKVYFMCHVTIMHLAARRGDCELFDFLLKAGCDPNIRARSGKTPTQLITERTFGVNDLGRFSTT